ncbi:hypothetical protein LTR35_012312 [Friedmanniomyces endolithicus]|uniref:D-serine dehydratase-like domain-containing protein n=1 Tax=Friedmanniomyces endolithicus TaxID=329885 RepID=A0AAN6FEI4_9PEZI|nr:hypothetical protein LTR35_012312 [Friedmanniomyces endolithicus]KAK0313345.1 hypothetical protein LTR82_013376 [Friedmanniomyces endolithicus]KAK0976180.1 hypothetical protein LTR54_016599 [Friedmanniomyces endolithicus]
MTSPMPAPLLYPSPSEAALKLHFLGKKISDVPAPAAIIDLAVVNRNCRLMLQTASELGVAFRAHVKTHKACSGSNSCICWLGVLADAMLLDDAASEASGWERFAVGEVGGVDWISILSAVARALGAGSVGLFVDHPTHIKLLDASASDWRGQIPVWVNIDVGYHREGVSAHSAQLADVAYALAASKRTRLAGLYTHMGHSYNVSSPAEALEHLALELEGLEEGAVEFLKIAGARETKDANAQKVILSIGATPTATAAQNLFENTEGAKKYRTMIEKINKSFAVELHAGVYPVMDMQQLATRARPAQSTVHPTRSLLSFADLGLRMLVEVASLYPDRGEKPEALIAAGSIVLGREACKSYPGWGVVSPWPQPSGPHYDPESTKIGWIVGRISQEHGVLTWEGPTEHIRLLEIGEKLLVWPNHACIAGVNVGWYLVVDSDTGDPQTVVDVWVRWRGW